MSRVQTPTVLSSSHVTSWSIIWILAAILPYFIFSTADTIGTRPVWFKISTYLFTDIALLAAALLCCRNWRQPRIPSGQWVWLLFGLAISFYLIGEIILSIWELYWGFKPDGSPADFAFTGFYLLTIGGVGLMITRQRVTLNWQQSIWLFLVSALATGIALKLTAGFESAMPYLTDHLDRHSWIVQIDRQLKPFAHTFNVFYILADLVLIILATILSLGFWGGRLGKTWQVVAQGIACLYLADLRFAYLAQTTGYESGDLMEIFWIAGMLQLGIAAAIEWENGYRAQRIFKY